VILVRHASAGNREKWGGDDALRPLDKQGRKQAKAIAKRLKKLGATRLVSSPYVRCVQTFEPAAERLGVPLEERAELAETASPGEVLSLLEDLAGSTPALSTHGNIGWDLVGAGEPFKKASIWILEVEDDRIRAEAYLPP
jgi:8-oxo-(d)GTP phosphatase